jgi:nucleoside-diphosphate-sugar epimerase
MRVLVTGGSGFIGTNLISLLESNGHEILNIDISAPRNEMQNKFWQKVDIRDFVNFKVAIIDFNPDYIIHLAARTDLDENKDINGYSANIEGVRNLMDICAELTQIKRIVVASSMLVCKLGYIPENGNDYCPTTLYGESKVQTEKIVKDYPNLDWILVRPTSIWGPWFGAPYNSFFKLVMSGRYVNLKPSHAATKTYGYVHNTCLQILSLVFNENDAVKHGYFYLGDNTPINISVWADIISNISNGKKVFSIPSWSLNIAGKIGDFIISLGLKFPMSSFRYKNMTTNHVMDMTKTFSIMQHENKILLKNELVENSRETINWINKINNK